MTKEKQFKDKLSVDALANSIQEMQKSTRTTSFFKSILFRKLKSIKSGELTIIDGSRKHVFGNPDSEFKAELEVFSQEFYVFLGSGGTNGAAEAFTAGYWGSNNLVKLIQLIIKNKKTLLGLESGLARLANPITKLIHKKRQNTLAGSKNNILAHYDLSNDFYKLWLDPTMTYSSGVFLNKNSSMKEASIEKLDRICRKLKLKNTDHVLEIGTGWEALQFMPLKTMAARLQQQPSLINSFNMHQSLYLKKALITK